jgi:integrase
MLDTGKIKKLALPATGSRIVYDFVKGDSPTSIARGFGARITAAGAVSFVLNYRTGGQERRLTIGSFPAWSVSAARAEARRLRVLIDQGEDPLGEREAAREAPTVRDLAQRYVTEWLPRKRPGSQRDDRAMLGKWILPAFGSKKVAAVRPADVEALHTKITKAGAPTRANRVIALCSKMFSLATRWEIVERNPCRGAIQRNPETRRKRYLSGVEIGRLSEALASLPSQPAANAIRLLLLTGARKSEVTAARWAEFDAEAGTWTKPAASTKQKSDHFVPLSAPALQLLATMRATAKTKFLFPGRDGLRHLDLRTSWESVRRGAGLEDVHLHDLRHSFASILVSAGASLPLIGALLGHSNVATTNRYSHLFVDAQRAAAERVGEAITGAKNGPGEIVPLERARR